MAIPRIRTMRAYLPPPTDRNAACGIKLDANERTTAPSAAVLNAIRERLSPDRLMRYPDYGDLTEKIARYVGVDPSCIMVTNGSDQAISLVFRAFTDTGDTVIIPTPSFSMYALAAESCGAVIKQPAYQGIPVTAFPTDDVTAMITKNTKLIVLCNPNNPTGTRIPVADIARIAERAGTTPVLVDEAYAEFSGLTAIPQIKTLPNLIVIRTFSKAFGLAGARIGYVVADPAIIRELEKIRGPYDVNALATIAASAALDDRSDMRRYVRRVIKTKRLLERFFAANRIPFAASAGNFLLFYPDDARRTERILRQNGILVRTFSDPTLSNSLRITVGTEPEIRSFIRTYETSVLNRVSQTKYAFIDRDGTLIFEPPDTFQINSIRELRILPGVIDGLKLLMKNGYTLVMVTNQDGLGSPQYPLRSFQSVQRSLLASLRRRGIAFESIRVCTDLPADNCSCRKPKTGLLADLIRNNRIDPKTSVVCGDRASDRGLAASLGIRYVPMQTNGNFLEAVRTLTRPAETL